MYNIIKINRSFFIPFLIFIISGFILVLSIPKLELHVYTNQYHHVVLDYFFRYITHLGSGYPVLLAGIALLFIRFRWSIIVWGSGLLTGIVVQLFKRYVFDDFKRPVTFFEKGVELYTVKGVNLHTYFSFPSGHSASAFALFLCLALFVRSPIIKFLFFIIALLVAYSRVYISQHFMMDITAGSFIGVVCATVIYYFINKHSAHWLDSSILNKSGSV